MPDTHLQDEEILPLNFNLFCGNRYKNNLFTAYFTNLYVCSVGNFFNFKQIFNKLIVACNNAYAKY